VRIKIGPCLRPAIATALLLLTAAAPAEENLRGDVEHGEKLYNRYCRGCHGEEGKGDGLVFMPHVNNLTKKGYIEELPDTYLLLAIQKGGPGIGKSSYMPSFETTLNMEQIRNIIGYVRSLSLN